MRRSRLRLLPLCLAVSGAVHAQAPTEPATWQLCTAPRTLPWFVEPAAVPVAREGAPSDVTGDILDVKKDHVTVITGNVVLTHGDQWLNTEKLTYIHEDERFATDGAMRYQDNTMRMTADKAEGDQKTDTLNLDGVVYQFNRDLGNGTAEQAVMTGAIGNLSDATYSTCPPGQRQWEFSANSIRVNNDTATGLAKSATLRLGGIPVLWLPVVWFPTDDRRRTGILSPTIGRDDQNGLDIKLPVYLNLAPNYDATLTPRWLSKRGLMVDGEFRFMTGSSRGMFTGTYLPNDDISGRDRSFVSFQDVTTFSRHWYGSANINHVSDVDYFADFGDSIAATSISLINSTVGMYGRGKYWSASLTAEQWQIANSQVRPGDEPYRRLPRLQAAANRPLTHWLEAGLTGEMVRFSHETRDAGGSRFDIQPYLRAPLSGGAWFLTPQIAWRYTRYSLEDSLAPASGDTTLSRSLPVMSLDAGAFFERNYDWGDKPFVQTLEPRLYYLRVPYRDQTDLPLFDTAELTFGWTSLFRDNRFGGADRQADANQASLSLTSRILDGSDGRERLSMGVGRITFFDAPRVTLPGGALPAEDGSSWVANMDMLLTDNWTLGVTQQWDPGSERTQLSSVRSQYRFGRRGGIVNAAYRYRQNNLEQTDLSLVVPLSDSWRLYGRWDYSLRDEQTLEALAGLEKRSCCMAIRILGRQYIRSATSQENFGLYLEIELTGLGSFGRDTARLIDNAILGYTR